MSEWMSGNSLPLTDDPILQLLENMDDGVFLVDAQEHIAFWNSAMARIVSLVLDLERATLEEVLKSIIPDDNDRRLMLETVRRTLTSGDQAKSRLDEVAVATMTDAPKFLSFEILPFQDSKFAGVLVIAHDETRRAKAQRDLETLLRYSSDGILVLGQDGQITLFNDALERMTGYKREEVLYQSEMCGKIFNCTMQRDSDEIRPVLEHLAQVHEMTEPFEHQITTKDGRNRWVEISYSTVGEPSGRSSYVICIVRDVHEKKRLRSQMQLQHKLATLGEVVSGLAHEIRNPLGIIRSAADIVSNETRTMAQRREAARFIQDETQTLGRIMDVLLSIATPLQVEENPLNVNDVLQHIFTFYTPERESLHIEMDLKEDIPRVCASRDALQTAFLNLVMNADQAMPSGGNITIRTERNGKDLRITVSDNGPGIAPHIMDEIFEPFFSTRPDGAGLGLPLVAHIVKAHGGAIRAENNKSSGAIFTIDLPGSDQEE